MQRTRAPLGDLLRDWAVQRPDRVCCALDETSFTFSEMDARSDQVAAGVAALGVTKGTRVASARDAIEPLRGELPDLETIVMLDDAPR